MEKHNTSDKGAVDPEKIRRDQIDQRRIAGITGMIGADFERLLQDKRNREAEKAISNMDRSINPFQMHIDTKRNS